MSRDAAAEPEELSTRQSGVAFAPHEPKVGVHFESARGEAPGQYFCGPPILEQGARVGILCDTLHGDHEVNLDLQAAIAAASELIERMGYVPVVDSSHVDPEPYFKRWAGTVGERSRHLVRLIDAYDVDALFPLFGKGGCHGVVDSLAVNDYRPRRPIVLIGGFSHHTDLGMFAVSDRGRGFFSHVINASQCAYWKILPKANADNLAAVLHGASRVEYGELHGLNSSAQNADVPRVGALAGGNLGAILHNAQKSWMPSLRDRIVVCEDYDRHPHDIYRCFSALVRLSEDSGTSAIVIGAMLPIRRPLAARHDPEQRRRDAELQDEEVTNILREVASRTWIPVFHNRLILGHGAMNYPLGLGGRTEIRPGPGDTSVLSNELSVWATARAHAVAS
jgi:muramoyltetrapeptide carboxypeptidase LdcA involved in peptidoglycan recycling